MQHIERVESTQRVSHRPSMAFGAGSTTELEFLDESSSGDLAFWTGYQRADVEIEGKKQHMNLRITEVFRRVDGSWKMVHRHASKASE